MSLSSGESGILKVKDREMTEFEEKKIFIIKLVGVFLLVVIFLLGCCGYLLNIISEKKFKPVTRLLLAIRISGLA